MDSNNKTEDTTAANGRKLSLAGQGIKAFAELQGNILGNEAADDFYSVVATFRKYCDDSDNDDDNLHVNNDAHANGNDDNNGDGGDGNNGVSAAVTVKLEGGVAAGRGKISTEFLTTSDENQKAKGTTRLVIQDLRGIIAEPIDKEIPEMDAKHKAVIETVIKRLDEELWSIDIA